MGNGKWERSYEICYNRFVGVSSETSHVSLCDLSQRGTHFYTRALGRKNLSALFLSLPIDSFSVYFKKSTDRFKKRISTCCDPQFPRKVGEYTTFDGISSQRVVPRYGTVGKSEKFLPAESEKPSQSKVLTA